MTGIKNRVASIIPAGKRWLFLVPLSVAAVYLIGCATMKVKRDWRHALSTHTVEAYEGYLGMHPKGEYSDSAKRHLEELLWLQATGRNTAGAYWDFLARCPNGHHSGEAVLKLEGIHWAHAESVNSVAGYRGFLEKYPSGSHSEKALLKLEELVWADIRSRDRYRAYEEFLKEFPDSRYAVFAKARFNELLTWEATKAEETVEAYEKFLAQYPTSEFSADARRALAWLRPKEKWIAGAESRAGRLQATLAASSRAVIVATLSDVRVPFAPSFSSIVEVEVLECPEMTFIMDLGTAVAGGLVEQRSTSYPLLADYAVPPSYGWKVKLTCSDKRDGVHSVSTVAILNTWKPR